MSVYGMREKKPNGDRCSFLSSHEELNLMERVAQYVNPMLFKHQSMTSRICRQKGSQPRSISDTKEAKPLRANVGEFTHILADNGTVKPFPKQSAG